MDAASPNFSYDFQSDPFLQYTNGFPISQNSPRLNFSNLNLSNPLADYSYQSNYVPVSSSPGRSYTPIEAISPPLTNLTAANLSSSDLSGDGGFNSGKRSRGTSSGGRSPSPPLVHRQPLRHSASSSTTATRGGAKERIVKRRNTKSDDLSDDDEDIDYAPVGESYGETKVIAKRREEIRRQRIESEQRRRDELREGYRKLKDVLPASNQKSSKVSLLDRATLHIKYLEMTQSSLSARLQSAEMETQRLRLVNEKLMLGAAEHNQHAVAAAAAAVASMPSSY